jgi:hypothetical protein
MRIAMEQVLMCSQARLAAALASAADRSHSQANSRHAYVRPGHPLHIIV